MIHTKLLLFYKNKLLMQQKASGLGALPHKPQNRGFALDLAGGTAPRPTTSSPNNYYVPKLGCLNETLL